MKTVRAKILGGFSFIIVICLLPMSLFFPNFISSLMEEKQNEVLLNSGSAFKQLIKENKDQVGRLASLIALNSTIVDYTFLASLSGDASLLKKEVSKMSKVFNLTTLDILITGSKEVIGAYEKSTLLGSRPDLIDMIRADGRGLIFFAGSYFITSKVSIMHEGEEIGTLLASVALSPDLIGRITDIYDGLILIIQNDTIIISNEDKLIGKPLSLEIRPGDTPRLLRDIYFPELPQKIFIFQAAPFIPLNESGRGVLLIGVNNKSQKETERRALSILLGMIFIIILVSLVWGLLITQKISAPIREVVAMLQELGKGNLSKRIKSNQKDEIGILVNSLNSFADLIQFEILTAFKNLAEGDFTFKARGLIRHPLEQTNEKLNQLLSELNGISIQTDQAASSFSLSTQALASSTTEQTESVKEIMNSSVNVGEKIGNNVKFAEEVNVLALNALNSAEEGNRQMEKTIEAISDLNESGKSISNIIKTIDEIAFQTNLLALNAAVEAARAGVHGKGFAVVAEEVRSLANRSADAGRETAGLIESSTKKTERGARLAQQTEEILERIVAQVSQVTEFVGGIVSGSKEQEESIALINQNLFQIEKATLFNSENAEGISASAKKLSLLSTHMNSMMKSFKLLKTRSTESSQ